MKQLLILFFLLPLIGFSIVPAARAGHVFSVLDYGAHADGRNDDRKAFMDAWDAACAATGSVTLFVPPQRAYLVGPVKFKGPCVNVTTMTVEMQGYLKAVTSLNVYVQGDDWIEFAWVNDLVLKGGGTFDGQGALSWPYSSCRKKKNCKVLPTSVKFVYTNNTIVRGIKSLNSKFFHFALIGCYNFWGDNLRIDAPYNSPNTDGFHLERNSGVSIFGSVIATGDDCISIGHSNENVVISGVTCGPGHGISIGSLGRYDNEGDVRGLVVQDSKFIETTNGIRIKTWEDSPSSSYAGNMTFKNLVMEKVDNPIIIDQAYCPYSSCTSQEPSRVRLGDITFSNIRGTTVTPMAVTLKCSRGNPCKNVHLHNVKLRHLHGGPLLSTCFHVKAKYTGAQVPQPCLHT